MVLCLSYSHTGVVLIDRPSVFSFHSRVGQRGGGLNSSAARSEHEVSEIIDGISEHEVSSSVKDALLFALCSSLAPMYTLSQC